jgi:hypothetical protein
MSISDENGAPKAQGDGLLFGRSQLDATGDPGSLQHFDLTVTNVGAGTQTVTGHGRSLSRTLSDQRGSVTLDTTAPTTMPGRSGAAQSYVRTTFPVGQGADHLDASIAWSDPDGAPMTLVLLDPKGSFAGYSLPQAAAGPDFGHVDVHDPLPGTWTALIYRPHAGSRFTGPVNYEFTTTRYVDFGSVSGPLRLPPGHTGTLRVTARTPARPGDLAAAVVVSTAAHQRFSVPLVLRSLVGRAGRSPGCCPVGTGGRGPPRRRTRSRSTSRPGRRTSTSASRCGAA